MGGKDCSSLPCVVPASYISLHVTKQGQSVRNVGNTTLVIGEVSRSSRSFVCRRRIGSHSGQGSPSLGWRLRPGINWRLVAIVSIPQSHIYSGL